MESKGSNDQIENLEKRVREVERVTANITGTIASVSSDVSELKQMFKAFLSESQKIAELSVKMQLVEKVDNKCDILFKKYDAISSSFNTLKAEHNLAQVSRAKSEDFLKELGDRLLKIESGRLATIEESLKKLTESEDKIKSMAFKWIDKIAWIIFLAILLMLINDGKSLKTSINSTSPIKFSEHQIEQKVNDKDKVLP